MRQTNHWGIPYRPGTFDDPKTYREPREEPEPQCHRCGDEPAYNETLKDGEWLCTCDDCYYCDCGEPAEYEYEGETLCEDCLYQAYLNDLPDCQCSFEDYKYSPEIKEV